MGEVSVLWRRNQPSIVFVSDMRASGRFLTLGVEPHEHTPPLHVWGGGAPLFRMEGGSNRNEDCVGTSHFELPSVTIHQLQCDTGTRCTGQTALPQFGRVDTPSFCALPPLPRCDCHSFQTSFHPDGHRHKNRSGAPLLRYTLTTVVSTVHTHTRTFIWISIYCRNVVVLRFALLCHAIIPTATPAENLTIQELAKMASSCTCVCGCCVYGEWITL